MKQEIQDLALDGSIANKEDVVRAVVGLLEEMMQGDIDLHKEAETMMMGYTHSRSRYEVDIHAQPTFKMFSDCLLRAKGNNLEIAHVSGHSDRRGFFWLEDDDATEYEHGENEQFAKLFKTEVKKAGGTVGCAVLNSCDSEELGRKLREYGVPYVVCWRSKVRDTTAIIFAQYFYMALDEGSDYPRAFEQAKNRLGSAAAANQKRKPAKDKAGDAIDLICFLSQDGDILPNNEDVATQHQAASRAPPDFQPCPIEPAGQLHPGSLATRDDEASDEDDVIVSDNAIEPAVIAVEIECEEDEGDDSDLRNWRPPKTRFDHGAHAGQHERCALQSLGFQMQLGGKDIEVGNGISAKDGFLDRAVFVMWGVSSYAALWGKHGRAVSKAHDVMIEANGRDKVAAASQSIGESLTHRNKDMNKHAKNRQCSGQCLIGQRCSDCAAARRPKHKCSKCRSLNCRHCVAKGQHEHMERLMQETKAALDDLVAGGGV